MTKQTKEEFIKSQCAQLVIPEEMFHAVLQAEVCDCGQLNCTGWLAVPKPELE